MLVASEVITVPKRDDLMLPVLSFAREKHLGESSDVFNVTWTFSFLIDDMGLSENVMDVKIKCGQSKFDSNVRWAIKYLKEAKLLKNVNRGNYKITKRGLKVLAKNPRRLNTESLKEFREFREYLKRRYKKVDLPDDQQSKLM